MATTAPKTARRTPRKTASNGKPAASRKPSARKPSAPKPAAKVAGKAAKATAKRAVKPTGGPVSRLARKALIKAVKAVGRRALGAGEGAVRSVAEELPEMRHRALEAALDRRLPIQVSIDIAVPVAIVWDEWMTLESLFEGVDRVVDVERDGDQLFGRLAGRDRDWEAEISDERPCQSFAWRSFEGSDCAGLVTFHPLAERLTRVEVDLDVVPTGPIQAMAFASHLAHRRAQSELRRFKAKLEFINPDVYEAELSTNGDAPPDEQDGDPEDES
jgi:uncharacterized membrane protein